jgi:hypothetical protein
MGNIFGIYTSSLTPDESGNYGNLDGATGTVYRLTSTVYCLLSTVYYFTRLPRPDKSGLAVTWGGAVRQGFFVSTSRDSQ